MRIEKGLYYTKEHEWLKVEDNVAWIGISDYAQEHLGNVVYVELPEEEDEVERGETVASLESVKAASDIYAPVSGTVVEINEALEDEPGLVNSEPYETWIVKLEMSDEEELGDLFSSEEYEKFLKEEE
ncbi:glycine cleavage system H protein [Peptostreptococcaceae bacterium oral taxon 113 str. W5053]|nr:glycine cleavage system H protein [Peptostreptococcaceae bacterium oral taxon 113 str. W5053]